MDPIIGFSSYDVQMISPFSFFSALRVPSTDMTRSMSSDEALLEEVADL
jgi:hypothetical protein